MLSHDTKTVWSIDYAPKLVPVLKGKKKNHVIDLIGGITILGRPTTREIANFVLLRSKSYEYGKVRDSDSRIREQIYHKLLVGRKRVYNKKKKLDESYPGLVSWGYVSNVGFINKKNRNAKLNMLTLKGCFFALGYHLNDDELKSFIRNSAINHISFAYLNTILEKTSIQFMRKTFIEPIQDLIKREKISLDDNVEFYFSFIADHIETSLNETIRKALIQYQDASFTKFRSEYLNHIEILIKNTWYDGKNVLEWTPNMMNLYFQTHEQQEISYGNFPEKDNDFKLLFRLMRAVHFAHYAIPGLYGSIPQKHIQNLKLTHKKHKSTKMLMPPDGKAIHRASELLEYENKIKNRK